MTRRHYAIFLVVVAAGLFSSLLLIPGPSQTALLFFKGQHYDRAARIYEARLAAGDDSVDVVVPLAQLYLERGKTERAVRLLKNLPPRADRDHAIADFYKSALQPEQYLQTIEKFDRWQLSEKELRELCDLYRDRSRYADLKATLRILIARFPRQADDFVELANIEASQGDAAAAEKTMKVMAGVLPRPVSSGDLDLRFDPHGVQVAVRAASGHSASPILKSYRAAEPPAAEEPAVATAAVSEKTDQPTRGELLEKLYAAKDDSERLGTIYALLDMNARAEVLPTLAELAHRKGGDSVDLFVDTANHAGSKPELMRFLTAELERHDLPRKTREDRLYVLLDCCGQEAALPWLKEFAGSAPGSDWASAYEEALTKLGRQTELIAYWQSLAARTDLSAEQKRATAFQLLDAGAKKPADEIFRALARNAGPESSDVEELLYLWGPRPSTDALDWLESRARNAQGKERAGWVKRLSESGASDRLARIMAEATPATGHDSATADAWLAALESSGKQKELGDLVIRETRNETSPDRLRKMAQMARDAGQQEAARTAYEKLLSQSPCDADTLRSLGMQAYDAGRYTVARSYLVRYFRTSPGDPETNLAFGEILTRAGDRDALTYFRRGLDQSARRTESSVESRVRRAQLLNRMGRGKEALAEFRKLVAEHPSDMGLRADFAELLLAQKSYREAEEIASTR